MAKRKNWAEQLVAERYFVWAVVYTVVVGTGLIAQISLAKIQFDSEAMASSYLTIWHNTQPGEVHKKR